MLRNNEIHCQICKNDGHEALLCPCAECIYCKSGNHTSYYCESDKNKIECNLLIKRDTLEIHVNSTQLI